MKRVAVIENGPSLCSYFERLLRHAGVEHFSVPAWRGAGFPDDFTACILTGDFHNVSSGLKDYHRRELQFLEGLGTRKAFASCFSHQLIAMAHGGRIAHRERRLLRWEEVALSGEHPWAPGITKFDAVCLNIDQVADPPEDAEVVGTSENCRNHVLSYGENILTCQGHPEMALRRGHMRLNALALALAGGTTTTYRDYRRSRPAALPSQSEFMNAVIRWLIA
ncbi:MAG: type 1 glutamine amidotransferase [Candidatus Geothermincolia bacterium]